MVVLRKVQWSGDFVLSDQEFGIAKVPFWFSSVFCCRVSLPPYQEGVMTGFSPVSKDCLDFIFFFAINKVQWWLEEVGSML